MRIIIMLLIIGSFSIQLKAQTYDEIFRQKETQTKYLLKQIAGLQIYLSYARKGYEVIEKGSQVVQSIKEIGLNEHQTFFKSLEKLNTNLPVEEKDKAINIQLGLLLAHQQFINRIRSSRWINGEERQVLTTHFESIEAGVNNEIKIINDLEKISVYQLDDKERWSQIEGHNQKIQSYQKASWSLRNDVKQLLQYREKEAKELKSSQHLNGLKP